MTTILADANLGLMVSDSNICADDRVWKGRKVWRVRGVLLGFSGNIDESSGFIEWWRDGCRGRVSHFANSECLALSLGQLLHFIGHNPPSLVKTGIESIGSGAKAAICTYEALGYQNPRRAVTIVCRNDNGSRPPVRVYSL